MSRDSIFKCLIAFTLGYLFARMMRGNGLSVGGEEDDTKQKCISGESNDSGYCSPVAGYCASKDENGDPVGLQGIHKYINDRSVMCVSHRVTPTTRTRHDGHENECVTTAVRCDDDAVGLPCPLHVKSRFAAIGRVERFDPTMIARLSSE